MTIAMASHACLYNSGLQRVMQFSGSPKFPMFACCPSEWGWSCMLVIRYSEITTSSPGPGTLMPPHICLMAVDQFPNRAVATC